MYALQDANACLMSWELYRMWRYGVHSGCVLFGLVRFVLSFGSVERRFLSRCLCVHGVLFIQLCEWIRSGGESGNADQIHEMHEHELQLRLALGNDGIGKNATAHNIKHGRERKKPEEYPSKINNNMSKICKQNGILMHEAIILCTPCTRKRERARERAMLLCGSSSNARVTLNDGKCEPNHKQPLH